jgi:hypothetical protein
MPGPLDRISQEVTDISAPDQLLRYALAGQLDRLRYQRPDVSQGRIAEAARLRDNQRYAASALSHALREGPSVAQLTKLDEVIGVLSPDLDSTGGLSSLNMRLSAGPRGGILMAQVPPSWTAGSLVHRPSSELEVLAQASALLSTFSVAERVDDRSVREIRYTYRHELELLVRRLVLISVSPPTARSYDAQMMLGSLASYAFEPMQDWLETAVRYSPMAFRVWRAITKLVRLRSSGDRTDELREWVQRLVSDSGALRPWSLDPGQSLDLELALAVPAAWSPASNDWAGDALRSRARDSRATIRERGTAAMGLWQRALEQNRGVRATEQDLRDLIDEIGEGESRPDAPAGLRWVAATLRHAIDNRVPVCNDWPEVDEPWFDHVQEAARELDRLPIADHLRASTKTLFLHMILQNAGVYRRQAIETVVTAGMTNPVAQALGRLLQDEQDEAWLRSRAESALGSLQRANRHVEDDLTHACQSAYRNLGLGQLAETQEPPRSRITEVHASLFAIGDCFGVPGVEDRAKSARDRLKPVLTDLAEATGDRAMIMRRAARAAAYLLAVTALPQENGKPDLSKDLLEKLQHHPDEVTARLSRWALSFRFKPDGSVRPLLDAPEHETIEDSPYEDPY